MKQVAESASESYHAPTKHLMGRCGVSKPIRRLQDENLVSLVQWLGPHRTAKAQPDHRPRNFRESHIPEWLSEAKTKRSIEGVQVSDVVTAKELGDPT